VSVARHGPRVELVLLGLGLATAAVYGLFFLWQFPLLGHVGTSAAQIPAIAPGRWHAALLVVGWSLLAVLYVAAYFVCRHARGRVVVAIILAGSLGFGLLLLFTYPFGSTDVFDYVARAHFAADKGGNPMYYSPASYPGYPYYQYITSVGTAGAYGPLWQVPADAIAGILGPGIVRNLLGMKLFVLACYWCGAPLVYWSLRRTAPAHAVRGLLLYAWNPLALIEVGADGHNDAVQIICLVVAAALLLARRPVAGSVAVVAASLVKFSPLLILPLFLVAVIKLPTTWRRRVASMGVFLLASAALTLLLYLPFGVAGIEHNLADLLGHGGLRANSIVWSLVGTSTTGGANDLALAGLAIVIAVLAYHFGMLLRREVTRDQLPAEILRRSFFALLALLALGLTWFWPWYVLWLLPFAALAHRRSITVLMVVFTVSAFAVHWSSYYQTVAGDQAFQLPLVAVLFGPVALTGAYLVVKRMPALRPRQAS
jgi:hypothetical protein